MYMSQQQYLTVVFANLTHTILHTHANANDYVEFKMYEIITV